MRTFRVNEKSNWDESHDDSNETHKKMSIFLIKSDFYYAQPGVVLIQPHSNWFLLSATKDNERFKD